MNPDAPADVAVTVGAPPAWLTPGEAEVWTRLAPILSDRRVVTEADLFALECACGDIAFAQEVTRDPDARVNEKLAARKAVWAALMHFGLTPATKAKVSVVGPKPAAEDDPLAEFDS